MLTIKRYSNRKLYDPQAGRYVTLEEIGQAVRRGEDLRVVDHASGADLTTLTLLQIVLEQERRASGWLPRQVLARLLRAGGERLTAIHDLIASPLDSRERIDQTIRQRVAELTARGRLSEEEAGRWLELLLDPDLSTPQKTPSADLQPATRVEIQALLAQIERLETTVEELLARA